jgi:hypothetical protein
MAALCKAKYEGQDRKQRTCGYALFKCKNCGSTGCVNPKCPKYNFMGSMCRTCNKQGTIPL